MENFVLFLLVLVKIITIVIGYSLVTIVLVFFLLYVFYSGTGNGAVKGNETK